MAGMSADPLGVLTQIFRELFEDDKLVLRPEMTPKDVSGWDSTRMMNIILAIEEKFDFEMSSAEMDSLRSIGDIVAVIEARTGSPPQK
jgi:acyl carrier protein